MDPDPARSGGGGGGVGGVAVWHQGFVIEQDILISVELISIQEAAVPAWYG